MVECLKVWIILQNIFGVGIDTGIYVITIGCEGADSDSVTTNE